MMSVSQKHLAMTAWAVALTVLVVGYARIELHDVRRVRSAEAEASALRARIDRSRAIVRNRVSLLAARKNIIADISEQASHGGDGDLGSLLASLDRSARRTGLAILAVQPAGGAVEPSKNRWLRSRAVRMVVRGSFEEFLTFLPDLSSVDPLVLIRDVAIAPAGRARVHPRLSFTLDVAAYTVSAPSGKE